MTLDTNGLGIGTTSPDHKLHVKGDVTIDNESSSEPSMLHFNATNKSNHDPTARINFWEGDAHTGTYTDSHAYIEYNGGTTGGADGYLAIGGKTDVASNTDVMVINRLGRVGIGTNSPDASTLLHVQGVIGTTNGTAAAPTHTFYGDPDNGMFRAAANTLAFSTDGNERLRINSSGDVGIGGTSAGAKLEIHQAQVTTQFDRDCFLRLHPTATTNSGGFTNIMFGTSTVNNFGVAIGGVRAGTNGTPSFSIRMLNDAIAGTEVLNITNSGNATFAGNVTVDGGQILTPSGTNLALNPNTGTVNVGGVIQCSGTGDSNFGGNITAPSLTLASLNTQNSEATALVINGSYVVGTRELGSNAFNSTPIPSAYTHPTHPGDDISIDTGALTGATIISDLDFNITTDTSGHVTDANGTASTRTLTLADLGYTGATNANNYSHPTHAGDDISIDTGALTGATVISDLDFNVTTDGLGHVTDANGTVSTRTLTAANLGISAPNAPASASAAIVGNTVEVTFAASTTSNIDAYLVYSSIDGSDYGLISIVPPDDFAASMSIIDNAFDETGTQAYRVYAMKYGILSSATTASVSYTVSSAEPTTMSVVNLNNAYYVQWNPPSSNARFVTAYNVYKHEHATQGSLSRSSASLIYSGMNTNYMYQISGSNNNNFHQFWVETTIA